MKNLEGRVAFITGAASGIGLGIAKACGKAGMKVIIADVRQQAIDEVLPYFQEKGWPVHGIQRCYRPRGLCQGGRRAESVLARFTFGKQCRSRVPARPLWESTLRIAILLLGLTFKAY